jgi:hypothetical protein
MNGKPREEPFERFNSGMRRLMTRLAVYHPRDITVESFRRQLRISCDMTPKVAIEMSAAYFREHAERIRAADFSRLDEISIKDIETDAERLVSIVRATVPKLDTTQRAEVHGILLEMLSAVDDFTRRK